MKKIERILNNLEKALAALFALLVGIISYVFLNIEKLSVGKLITLSLGFILLVIAICVGFYIYVKNFNKLED